MTVRETKDSIFFFYILINHFKINYWSFTTNDATRVISRDHHHLQ